MEHSLVRELETAGFPLKKHDYYDGNEFCIHCKQHVIPDELCPPTLSELIAALGQQFESLQHRTVGTYYDEEWEAWGTYFCCEEHGEGKKIGSASTTEVAVANLWLDLNTKST